MAKTILLPDMVCRVEKSGNRYNAYNTDGVKMTSEITTGCRKNAFNGDYLLGRFLLLMVTRDLPGDVLLIR